MAGTTLFWCPNCNRCRHLDAPPTDGRVRCIACDLFFPTLGRVFGPADWKTETDPFRIADALTELRAEPTPRKWRLLACAIGRIEFDWCRNPWFRDALDCAEKWADTGEQPRGTAECVAHFADAAEWGRPGYSAGYRHGRENRSWVGLARRLLRADPRPAPGDLPQWRTLTASLMRELVADPYRPLAWNPNWYTSTVRDLAARIYTERDFAPMPILADALQDAGCYDERILNHCRDGKQHARGCWVLDAILGKV